MLIHPQEPPRNMNQEFLGTCVSIVKNQSKEVGKSYFHCKLVCNKYTVFAVTKYNVFIFVGLSEPVDINALKQNARLIRDSDKQAGRIHPY